VIENLNIRVILAAALVVSESPLSYSFKLMYYVVLIVCFISFLFYLLCLPLIFIDLVI
jgi:hypothetical protein